MSTLFALLALLILLVSDFFSFSRYLWIFTVLALICGLCVGKKDRFQLSLIAVTGLGIVLTLPLLIDVITLRFSSTVISASDAERTEQISALRSFLGDAPWLGHGFGSYTTRVIRSDRAPYSYEAQLLALAGQVGVVGVSFLSALTIFFFGNLWIRRPASVLRSSSLVLLLLAWIAGGFFNPSVISSAAAVSYIAFYAMVNLESVAN